MLDDLAVQAVQVQGCVVAVGAIHRKIGGSEGGKLSSLTGVSVCNSTFHLILTPCEQSTDLQDSDMTKWPGDKACPEAMSSTARQMA